MRRSFVHRKSFFVNRGTPMNRNGIQEPLIVAKFMCVRVTNNV
jgi:hypothetical protein